MNPFTWIQGLQGYGLVGAICGLLFLEEIGVPLPFAPGDLMLAVAGIAIVGGRVDALPMILALFAAIVVGAAIGRELFALLGWDRLNAVARRLHAEKPLRRAADTLQRSGWRAVFTSRLIPGLRVYTTQVAGVSGMPRVVFIAGLIPSAIVYLAAFVGLGAAFGRPILGLIAQAERQILLVAVVGALLLVSYLLSRARLRTTLQSLRRGGFTGLTLRLGTSGLYLIPATIGMNFAGHALAVQLKLPLFLDSVGTVLAGVLLGPWVGGSVGLITNLVSSNTIDPIAAPYSVVSFAVGFAAGLSGYLNRQKQRRGWLPLWLVCFVIASVASTPLNILISAGRSGVPLGDQITTFLLGAHLPMVVSSYLGEAAIDLPDKLITVLVAALIYQGLPRGAPTDQEAVEVDLGEAFTYPLHTKRWRRRLLGAALCVTFSWLVLPLLLLIGYTVAITRDVRRGVRELPAWDRPGRKLADGFLIGSAFVIWNLPGALLTIPTDSVLNAIGGVWGLIVIMLQPAIWSEYLEAGFRGTLNLAGILRRLRVHLGLAIVVGALEFALLALALSGAVLLLVGVIVTTAYASWVGAYLVGNYARVTDRRPPLTAAVAAGGARQ